MNTFSKFWLMVILCNALSGAIAQPLVPYRLKDKWGYADTAARIVITPQFDSVGFFSGDTLPLAVVMKKMNGLSLYGLLNPHGRSALPVVYDSLNRMGPAQLLFRQGLMGWFLNGSKPFMVKPLYKKILKGNDEVLLVQTRENKYGVCYIKNGKLVAEKLFDSVAYNPVFSGQLESGTWFYNQKGETYYLWRDYRSGIYEYELADVASQAKEELAMPVERPAEEERIYTKIEIQGTTPLSKVFVKKENGKYGFETFGNKEVIPAVYDSIIVQGIFALLKRNNKWQILNDSLKPLTLNLYDSVTYYLEKKKRNEYLTVSTDEIPKGFWVKKKNQWRYLHADGKVELLGFDAIETISYKDYDNKKIELVKCFKNGKYRLAKTDFSSLSTEFEAMNTLPEKAAGRYGQYYTAKTDSCVYLTKYLPYFIDDLKNCTKLFVDDIRWLDNTSDYMLAEKKGRYGVINSWSSNHALINCNYDTVFSYLRTSGLYEKFFLVGNNGKKGVARWASQLYNNYDTLFIPCEFDEIELEIAGRMDYLKLIKKNTAPLFCNINKTGMGKQQFFFTQYIQPNSGCSTSDYCDIVFVKNEKWGVLNLYLQPQASFDYDSIMVYHYWDHPFIHPPINRPHPETEEYFKYPKYYMGRKGDSITLLNEKAELMFTQKAEALFPLSPLYSANACLFSRKGLLGICRGKDIIVPPSFKKLEVYEYGYPFYYLLLPDETGHAVSLALLNDMEFRRLPGKYQSIVARAEQVQVRPMGDGYYRYFPVITLKGKKGYIDEFGREFFKD